MRLFYAVPSSEAVRRIVWNALQRFPISDPPWKWIPPENYHFTLKFLGEVTEDRLPSLNESGVLVASQVSTFSISLSRFGGFPSLSSPRVIFYDLETGKGELRSLAGMLEREMEHLGFKIEQRPFRAHLTLARIKRSLPPELREVIKSVPSLPSSTVQEVNRFVLMRSHLSRSGARYEEIDSFELAKSS
jgi:2'-5' RNA ligase